eukprot:TRINITY_DN7765_c0_g1_i2.p1 TRINITY_DN7765_c0_g1~~TRINITY_DN7765_c0_g1_i2.p1  ORF type:complete len:762 (-),score=184.96 TRINITY_DN7765_c0_g1_i2:277-2562(-)
MHKCRYKFEIVVFAFYLLKCTLVLSQVPPHDGAVLVPLENLNLIPKDADTAQRSLEAPGNAQSSSPTLPSEPAIILTVDPPEELSRADLDQEETKHPFPQNVTAIDVVEVLPIEDYTVILPRKEEALIIEVEPPAHAEDIQSVEADAEAAETAPEIILGDRIQTTEVNTNTAEQPVLPLHLENLHKDVRFPEETVEDPSKKIPTFNEWNQQVMSHILTSNEVPTPPPVAGEAQESKDSHVIDTEIVKTAPKFNYASFECGAKILAANKEATDTGAILTDSKDRYMLNWCEVDKWVIFELCEDIHISSIEIANYEFFSSMVKDFTVHAKNGHPDSEWILLGNFTAQNIRELQHFDVPNIWCQYLKFSFLTHYGHEYFCPISVINVNGYDIHEELMDELKRDDKELSLLKEKIREIPNESGKTAKQTEPSEEPKVAAADEKTIPSDDNPSVWESVVAKSADLVSQLEQITKLISNQEDEKKILTNLNQQASEVSAKVDADGVSTANISFPEGEENSPKNETAAPSQNETAHNESSPPHPNLKTESHHPKSQENILKTLASRIKNLEINQSLYTSYLEDVTSRYLAAFKEIKQTLTYVQVEHAELSRAILAAVEGSNQMKRSLESRLAKSDQEIEALESKLFRLLNAELGSMREQLKENKDQERLYDIIAVLMAFAICLYMILTCVESRSGGSGAKRPKLRKAMSVEVIPTGPIKLEVSDPPEDIPTTPPLKKSKSVSAYGTWGHSRNVKKRNRTFALSTEAPL